MLRMSRRWKLVLTLWSALLCLAGWSCNSGEPGATGQALDATSCPLGTAVETDGYRRLALIVGVGQYKNPDIPPLQGAPNDARHLYEVLTGPKGYGFPKENVCVLLDAAATTARFRHAFAQALVGRAQPHDVVVVFFAGHGSQTRDINDDEPDGWDETLLLHDARTGGVGDLVDDEFHLMLTQLYTKTHDITVILDSCNSGTATRGDAGTFVARYMPPVAPPTQPPGTKEALGDGTAGWVTEALPGLVVFTAASDGTPALETGGRGVFTDALLHVLAQATTPALTYAQTARQIAPLVAARSYQIPSFQGDLGRPVFSNAGRTQPVAWEVIAVGPTLQFSGPPLPGMGLGAEVRIYDGAVTGAETRDPGKAKATVVIDATQGVNASGHIAAARLDAPPVVRGDIAVLARPADSFSRLKLRLRPAHEPGGIPPARAAAVRSGIAAEKETVMLVEFTEAAGDFELFMASDGRLQLSGPENMVRNTYAQDVAVPKNLWQHARQRALLHLQGEGGKDFVNHDTLQVQLVPAAKQGPCGEGVWEQAVPNTEQIVPLCSRWHVQVALRPETPTPLLIGGMILSTDGSLFGLPVDGRTVRLRPGERVTLNARQETFLGEPPVEVQDRVLIFGTKETNPVPWHLLTSTATERAQAASQSPLYRALDRYLQPGTRKISQVQETVEDTTWTVSAVTMRVRGQCPLTQGHLNCASPQ